MKDRQSRLIDMWLDAMAPENKLPGPVRTHLEDILGNEYRHTSPCRDCGGTPRTDRADESQAA